jgi:hypothetical protein
MASEKPIPTATVKIVVPVKPGDATLRIQAALRLCRPHLPADKEGIARSGVVRERYLYQVNGSLKINASGVILRGQWNG